MFNLLKLSFQSEVVAIHDLTPHMRRIQFSASDFSSLRINEPGYWSKLTFPASGGEKSQNRVYTVRQFDPTGSRMSFDFVLHGENGPGSRWAANAKVGDVLSLSRPRSARYRVDPAAQTHILIGDATFLPAVGEILAVLSDKVRATVIIEVEEPADEQLLPTPATLDITWLHSGTETPGTTGQIERTVRQGDIPTKDCQVWLAGESSMVRAVRMHLSDERKMGRSAIHAAGYWKLGKDNYFGRG